MSANEKNELIDRYIENTKRRKYTYSVTARIRQVKQPRGGYIKPKSMSAIILGEGSENLKQYGNIHASLIGITVDYLTRFMLGVPVDEAFKISFLGASLIGKEKHAQKLASNITGLNRRSALNAIKLCGYDKIYRSGIVGFTPVTSITPNWDAMDNVITLVERSLKFFNDIAGTIVLNGFTLEGGYSEIIGRGDGDYVTEDTLWDLKVSKNMIKKEHTLQLLIYWRMGLRSVNSDAFRNVKYLGIYNPHQNVVYKISVDDISDDVIKQVETEVIGYDRVLSVS